MDYLEVPVFLVWNTKPAPGATVGVSPATQADFEVIR